MKKRCRRNDSEEKNDKPALLQCANLILPWLNTSELASISLTCKTLYEISKSITISRSADASRSLENLPIPFINTVDGHPYAYFVYTPSQIITSPLFSRYQRQSWGRISYGIRPTLDSGLGMVNWGSMDGLVSESGGSAYGCDCEKCNEVGDGGFSCPCSSLNSSEIVTECGPSCRCGLECGNRVTQKGISVRLKIVRDWRKGWGLHADQLILCGQFVCEYAGELLTTNEARIRQQMYDELAAGGRCCSALMVVREHLPSGRACMRINVDATRVGNVARFINHSCDGGNLSTRLVRSLGVLLPRICFFATREIQEHEELTFSYGLVHTRLKSFRCFCGSPSCFGFLPSENT
ncbi:histone-lysine N-methyltransferase SUVR3 [Malania oleifera]|uniref:histone-lysine N-methyltransferase SUVR3 n=1 Tax=Malania oleifera TaxID=397392 RepID=UPI0025AE5E81|nr:histone-lysine N-methyltransferase SUVR3 [Malania oleifera]XP_057950164.1 histone-lysine N-methyltransferase SUVR3 [Malania oleifera]XP_057950165.1 histone-lysine N-methyltransferase SUVR3 [Malania oleifera]